MPEGTTESVQELDLDEQVQQLVESIETTTRDITARTAEDFGEDPLMTPEAVASLATSKDTPEESTPTETTEPGDESGDASDSDPVEEAASDPPEDVDLESEAEAVDETEADTVDDVDVDVVDEVEAETEPINEIEAVEEAIEQIDEAVDRLVENAVDSVDAAEPDSTVESADQQTSDADADAVEQEQIEVPAIEAPVSAEDNAEDNAECDAASPIAEPAENDEGESADDDAESATGPDDKFAVEGDFDSVGEAETAEQPESDAGDNEKIEEPIDEFEGLTSTTAAKVESPEPTPVADSSPEPVSASAPTETKKSVGSGIRIPAFVGSLVGGLAPITAKTVLAVNAPVRRPGPTARQTVGWIAINTAFLALCVLIIAIFRTAL